MSTREIICPILEETYGKTAMTSALADYLAEYINSGDLASEDKIRDTCWNFFSGGDTAAYVAKRIIAVIAPRETAKALKAAAEEDPTLEALIVHRRNGQVGVVIRREKGGVQLAPEIIIDKDGSIIEGTI